MFELSVTTHFSAAHRLVGYAGQCAQPHGHNWEVAIFLRGEALDDIGMMVDFRDVKQAVREIMEELDHGDLNALPAFAQSNPTSENLARYVYEKISRALNCSRYRIHRVKVCETPGTSASYWEDANG
jgi:6-pyruvoyltetrahydropterin/6-carboxytetrahydropterin synthase